MSHHGYDPFDGEGIPEAMRKAMRDQQSGKPEEEMTMQPMQKRRQLMRDLLDTTGFRGAIGSYPKGKLTPKDEGSIQFAVGEQDGKVVIDFGTPVSWIGMTPQQAADFASSILTRARLVGRRNGETITMMIGS